MTTKKKTEASSNNTTIKYTDKSEGQPLMVEIFEQIKALLEPYVKGSIIQVGGDGGQMHLITKKAIEIEGRKRNEVYFVSIMIQKGYVGFYYMPIYCNPKLASKMPEALMKCLKGKACFHIKKKDYTLMEQIAFALEIGYKCFIDFGWVDE